MTESNQMPPTIRIDEEVYGWLQGQAVPFNDTPNSVLRRIAGLEAAARQAASKASKKGARSQARSRPHAGRRTPLATGEGLIKRWGIPVRQARFHRDGHYYEHLTRFPAALCDPKGYIVFETEEDYRECQRLRLGQQINVEMPGIPSIPGYQTVDDPLI